MARSRLVRALLALFAALLLCASRGRCDGLRVSLEVREPVGVARTGEDVTVGIPLPPGHLRATDGVWVANARGAAVPSQSRIEERWPDGSVRWLLVDFLSTVAADARGTYSLRDGPAPDASPPAMLRRSSAGVRGKRLEGDGLTVAVAPETGVLAEIRRGDRLVATLALPAADLGGNPPPPTADGAVEVETDGPVRTEVRVSGRTGGDLAYEARLAVVAGTPTLRIQLSITSRPTTPYVFVRSLALELRGTFADAVLGVDGTAKPVDAARTPSRLRQADAAPAGCAIDGAACRAGDGWAAVRTGDTTVVVARRWFREEWPQAIAVGADALTLDLLAGGDDPLPVGVGAAKTFEIWIRAGSVGDPAATARALQHPLVAHVDPAWVAASHALPNAVAPGAAGVADFLPRLGTAIGRYLARNRAERWDDGAPVPCEQRTVERERVGAYGALNWGDWNFPGYRDRSEGCDAWGNLEYDLTQVLGLAWAVTGTRATWDAFIAAARHYRDVDVIHHAPGHEEWVGFNHPHKARHFAVESPNKVDLGHTWLEGLATHYRLTGERRSLDAVRGIADVLVSRRHKAGNPRQYGWPMIALAAAYDLTGDARYREAALGYADAAATTHDATPAAGDWKMGILADGVAAVHAITGETRLRDWLVRYADAFVATPDRFDDPRYALPLGYLAGLTGNARYRDAALAAVHRMPIGDWGKSLAISGRTAFRILSALPKAPAGRATPGRGAPRPPSDGGPRRSSRSR